MSALENNETAGSQLTDLETRILDFERNWWRFAGAKETAIKELFDLTAPRYYQLLNDLIDRDDALAASPMLVKRLEDSSGRVVQSYEPKSIRRVVTTGTAKEMVEALKTVVSKDGTGAAITAQPTLSGAAYSFTAALFLVPFIFHRYDSTTPGTVFLRRLEVGQLLEVGLQNEGRGPQASS